MWTRRNMLIGGGLALGSLALPGPAARALENTAKTRFIVVFARGGWDPLCVFAPLYGSSVDMEPESSLLTLGDLKIVDHPERPSVTAFFKTWGAQALVLNGLAVHSVAHETCEKLVMTGSASEARADWAAISGAADGAAYTVPHLVVAGPAFAGDVGGDVARTGLNGQLDGLLSSELLYAGPPVPVLSTASEKLLDAAVRRRADLRANAAATPRRQHLLELHTDALARADQLKRLRGKISFAPGDRLSSQVTTAVSLLASDVCRCITLSEAVSWDSHEQNHAQQTANFESLFAALAGLMQGLADTPGSDGAPLLARTVVVVISEMGRTPRLNGFQGRDHWPYTSALLLGGGLIGGRTIGGYDEFYNGLRVDPASLKISKTAPELDTLVFGATLLKLADLDPAEHLPRPAEPLEGLRG